MKQEFVTYEQALALKKIGFNMPVNWFVSVNDVDEIWEGGEYNWNGYTEDKNISLPLKQQVFRWFREKYGYIVSIFNTEFIIYSEYSLSQYLDMDDGKMNPKYARIIIHQESKNSYEEAESACIDKLISL